MATYTSISAVKAAIKKKTQQAIGEISQKGYETAQNNIDGFYTGTPVYYKRTGKLGDSPRTTGVQGKGSRVSTEIYLDDNYSYETGTWTAEQVMNAAENGYGNLVGTGGFGDAPLKKCQILLMMLCVMQDSVKNNMTYQRANRLFLI